MQKETESTSWINNGLWMSSVKIWKVYQINEIKSAYTKCSENKIELKIKFAKVLKREWRRKREKKHSDKNNTNKEIKRRMQFVHKT